MRNGLQILCCAVVAALANAGGAQAASYCVIPATGCDNNGVTTPQIALNNAQASPGPDTVVLGATTYTSPGYTYNATGSNSVEIDGGGRTATTLHTMADHQPVLAATGGASVTIQHLTANPFSDGANTPMSAISLDGPADVVNDVAINGGTEVTGVGENGGTLTMTASSVRANLATGSDGVDLINATATLADLTINTSLGITQSGGSSTIHRLDLTATEGIIVGTNSTHSSTMTIDDSVLRAMPGLQAIFATNNFSAKSIAVVGRHLTIIVPDGTKGVEAAAVAGSTATVQLDSSILRGGTPLDAEGGGTESVAIDYSDYAKSSSTHSGTGTLTDGTHNVNVDPQFVSATDFHLQPASPVIDGANPLLAAGESLTDLDGRSRAVAAAGGCLTRIPDMGAYEVAHHSPTAAATVLAGPTTTADAIGFDASASCDSTLNDPLTYAWAFDDGGTASGVTVSHRFATAGTHTATVVVTDSGAVTATASTTVTVTQAPPPQIGPIITKAPPPAFNGARLTGSPTTVDSRGRFSWKFACPAVASGCRGTIALTALSTSLRTHTGRSKTKAKPKPVKVASATFSLKPGQGKAVALRLTSTARNALRAHHKVKTAATLTSTEVGRLTGTFHGTPTLKPRPAPKRHKR